MVRQPTVEELKSMIGELNRTHLDLVDENSKLMYEIDSIKSRSKKSIRCHDSELRNLLIDEEQKNKRLKQKNIRLAQTLRDVQGYLKVSDIVIPEKLLQMFGTVGVEAKLRQTTLCYRAVPFKFQDKLYVELMEYKQSKKISWETMAEESGIGKSTIKDRVSELCEHQSKGMIFLKLLYWLYTSKAIDLEFK